MLQTMIETDLTIQDFTEYFKKNKLGKLFFPNGVVMDPDLSERNFFGHEFVDWGAINVKLDDLYRLMVGWKINKTEIPLDDIIGVIAFGSAVKYPGYKKVPVKKRKHFGIFGPKIDTGETKKVQIQPNDIDFFVLTENNITRHEYIKPKKRRYKISPSIGDAISMSVAGINLVSRGVDQLYNGIKNEDTISISVLKEGIPVFYDKQRLEEVISKAGIKSETPRKLTWDVNRKGYLIGQIE